LSDYGTHSFDFLDDVVRGGIAIQAHGPPRRLHRPGGIILVPHRTKAEKPRTDSWEFHVLSFPKLANCLCGPQGERLPFILVPKVSEALWERRGWLETLFPRQSKPDQ
jgi:hypothetical protein